MSVPSQQQQSWSQDEDGQPNAMPGSFYYYSPHSAAPGSERAWQENYHEMARRVTGGPSSWGQQHQQMPELPSNYGQQDYQYSMFQPATENTATTSDPWNWGLDETSNNESSNSSVQQQHDPTWDWSVDGSNMYQHPQQQQHQQQHLQHPQQQQLHQEQQQQQHLQHPQQQLHQEQQQQLPLLPPTNPSSAVNYNPEVQQTQTWNTSVPGSGNENHQHSYTNVPQNLQNIVEDSFSSPSAHQNTSGPNSFSFGTGDPGDNASIAEHNMTPHVSVKNENLNSSDPPQNESTGYFSGFPVGSNDVGFYQPHSVDYEHQHGSIGGGDVGPQEAIRSEQSSTDVCPDDRKSDSFILNRSSRSPSVQDDIKGSEQVPVKPDVVASEGSSGFLLNLEPKVEILKQERQLSIDTPDIKNCGRDSELIDTDIDNESLVSADLGSQSVTSSEEPMDKVLQNIQKLSLGSITTSNSAVDVENIEIAPPETNSSPVEHTPLPLPPIGTPLAAGGGSNPYTARNTSLNHKHANDHRMPQTTSTESGERMNYAVNLTQSEPDRKRKTSPHFVHSSEVFPGRSFGTRRKPMVPTAEETVNLETVPDNKERPDFDTQQSVPLDRKSVSPLAGSRSHAAIGQDSVRVASASWSQQQPPYATTPENQEIAPRCGPERNQYLETGQLPDDDLEVQAHSLNVSAGNAIDEIPPPGLRRMVPGESSSPESQGAGSTTLVSGIVPAGTFQPIGSVPMEPRVVTGVAQDEMDKTGKPGSNIQTPSPVPLSSGHVTTEPDSPSAEECLTASTLPQPPSERSETIGSDRVETYPLPPAPDNSSRELSVRRDPSSKERERRHRDDEESDERSRRRQTNGREKTESPGSGRYRSDDRDRRSYDHRDRNHDREESPSSGHYRYDSRSDYRHISYEDEPWARRRRRLLYERSDEEEDTEDYYSERDRGRKSDHGRDRGHERDRQEIGYRDDYHYHSLSGQDRDRHKGNEKGSRDKSSHRSGKIHDSERHDRDRGYQDRKRYDHEWNYRRYEDDGPYRAQIRSRPNSRSGRPEYEDDRRRDYRGYPPGYDYQRSMQFYYPYFYTHPAQWQPIPPQAAYHPEDRGSVHSGRSSANDELHRDRSKNSEQDTSATTVVDGTITSQRLVPNKFNSPHIKGIFTLLGQLWKIPPHGPSKGQAPGVQRLDLQNLFHKDAETLNELKDFPGPIIKDQTHKSIVIGFCNRKIQKAQHDPDLFDRDSVILLWRLLILLVKQNGIVTGCDIAELLLTSSRAEPSRSQRPSPAVSPAGNISVDAPSRTEAITQYREYLLYGNKKDALEWAMRNCLWGHAFFLASKMDERTYASVMIRFANGLSMNDPLQTCYQLMCGRQPAAVTCCSDEKWGDWKPHLAMIVSNVNRLEDSHRLSIITFGDTLAARGCLHAAHFCYVMAQLDFGSYEQKSSKIVLLGSSHLQPFARFATNEAIQMTEVYLYTNQLSNPEFKAPDFERYKLLYAQRLTDYGLVQEALQYVEVIAKAICRHPNFYSLNFQREVYALGNQLKYRDPVYLTDPDWLQHLAGIIVEPKAGVIQQEEPNYSSTPNLSYAESDSLQPQYHGQDYIQNNQQPHYFDGPWQQPVQQPYQEVQQWQQSGPAGTTDGYQIGDTVAEQIQTNYVAHAEPVPNNSSQDNQQPSHPPLQQQHSQQDIDGGGITDGVGASNDQPENTAFDYWGASANKQEGGPKISLSGTVPLDELGGPQPPSQHPPSSTEDRPQAKPKSKEESPKSASGGSWLGGILNKLPIWPKNQMILPDDKNPSIVWDPVKKRWAHADSEEDDAATALQPPPKSPNFSGNATDPDTSGDTSLNIYKRNRARGSRANYVDILGGKNVNSQPGPSMAPFPTPVSTDTPMNIFVPAPVEPRENNSIDFVSSIPKLSESSGQVSEESSQLSRWSSTSSLSREVQKYMFHGPTHAPSLYQSGNPDISVQPQPPLTGPMMYNPNSFSQPASVPSRKRYPR